MCTIDLTAENVGILYRGGNAEVKKLLKDELGEKFSELLPITERVKTFDDAVQELGEDNPLVRAYWSARCGYTLERDKDVMAYLKLRIITAAVNEGWEPTFVEGEKRWYPWFELLDKDQMEELSEEEKEKCRVVARAYNVANASGGLVYANASHVSSYSSTVYGSRLAFKSEELAEYAGKQFAEIYADYCFIPETEEK